MGIYNFNPRLGLREHLQESHIVLGVKTKVSCICSVNQIMDLSGCFFFRVGGRGCKCQAAQCRNGCHSNLIRLQVPFVAFNLLFGRCMVFESPNIERLSRHI